MTLEELKAKFNLNCCQAIDIAHAKYSKKEALIKIGEEINAAGVDVNGEYLDFVRNLEENDMIISVKYIPVYCCQSIARLSWKEVEEGQEPIDHQEFCKFNTIFYNHCDDESDRINKLQITKIFDKKELKLEETPVNDPNVLLIGTDNPLCDVSNLQNQAEIVMDTPAEDGEFYDIDGNYLCSDSDIRHHIQKALERTKSYKKLQKEKEKWSEIAKIEYRVVLVPVASIKVGLHVQLLNCTNGTLDVIYEKSKEITREVKKAFFMAIPTIALFAISSVAAFIIKWIFVDDKIPTWNKFPRYIFGNVFDVCWCVALVMGITFSIVAFPHRKGIVRRATNKKSMLGIYKKAIRFVIEAIEIMILICVLSLAFIGL